MDYLNLIDVKNIFLNAQTRVMILEHVDVRALLDKKATAMAHIVAQRRLQILLKLGQFLKRRFLSLVK